jgi:integrase
MKIRKKDIVNANAVKSKPFLKFADLAVLFLDEFPKLRGGKRSSATKRNEIVLRSLVPFFGGTRLSDISESLVLEFCMKSRERYVGKKKLSPKTVANHLSVLSSIFKWAGLRGHCQHNPVPLARSHFHFEHPPETAVREKVLDEKEFNALYEYLQANKPEMVAPVVVACFLGTRRGEVGGFDWSFYVTHDPFGNPLTAPYLRISKQVLQDRNGVYTEDTTKTSRERMIVCGATVVEVLQKWREDAEKVYGYSTAPDAPMFPIVARGPDNFSKNLLRRACEKAGLPASKRSFHGLRHTFTAWLRIRDTSPRQLQMLLGHSTPEMSERYGRVFGSPTEAIAHKLDGILPPSTPPPTGSTAHSGNVVSLAEHRRKTGAVLKIGGRA